MIEPPPLIVPPAHPLEIPESECYAVPATFGVMAGHGRARDAATSGMLRPADIDSAKVMPVERVYVPLWRFEGSVDGFHVRLHTVRTHRTTLPIPSGGFRHQDGEILVLARSLFPIDPAQKVAIASADLVPLAQHPIPDSERVVPDVTQEEAEREAHARFRRRGERSNAIYSDVKVRIRTATLVYYPLYVARYVYAGEATKGSQHVYHAAVSACTGDVVSTEHPPLIASVASKIRKLFG